MVSVQQARTQLQTQRTALQSQRQSIEQTRLPDLTKAQLRQQTRTGLAQRSVKTQGLERQKSQALEQLKPFEQELTKFEGQIVSVEKQIAQAEKQRSDFEQAKKLFQRGITDPSAPSGVRSFLQDFQAGREAQIEAQIETQLFTPIPELAFTPIPPPQFTPIPPKATTTEKIFGILKKPQIKIPIIGPNIPGASTITAKQFNAIISELGLAGKTAAVIIPETVIGGAAFTATGALGAGPSLGAKIVRSTVVGLGIVGAVDPDLEPEERIASAIVALSPLIPNIGKVGKKAFTLPKGKKGSAQFEALAQFLKKDKKKASELQRAIDGFSEQLTRKKVGTTVRDKTQSERVEVLRKVFDKIKNTKDPALRKEQVKGIVKLVKSDLGEAKANLLFKEFVAQEGIVLGRTPTGSKVINSLNVEVAKPFVPVVRVQEALAGTKVVLTKDAAVPGGLQTKTQTNILKNQQRIQFNQRPLKERFELGQANLKKKNELNKEISKEQIKLRTLISQKASQTTITQQKNKLKNLLKQRTQLRSLQATKQIQRTRLISPTLQRLKLRQAPRLKLKLKFPKPFAGLIRKAKKKKKIKKVKNIIPFNLKAKSFNVRVRKKGKFITIARNLAPNRAKRKLINRLDNTLRASGRLVPSNKPPKKKDIKRVTFRSDFFRRPVKGSPLRKKGVFTVIEKRSKRISTPGEKRALQKARTIKLKSTPMIIR